uniref:Uncharacterized protein n=1 Tax=Glossina pallidipes TaxID=7398 RepID=A0A1B0A3E2_GLOPL
MVTTPVDKMHKCNPQSYLSAFGKNTRHTIPGTKCNREAKSPRLDGTPKIVLIASLPQFSIAATLDIDTNMRNPPTRLYPAALNYAVLHSDLMLFSMKILFTVGSAPKSESLFGMDARVKTA